MGKRADVVLLLDGLIWVIEFKVGSDRFDRAAIEQVHDYALDLKNFHLGSHDTRIVPVLIATEAAATPLDLQWAPDGVAEPMLIGPCALSETLSAVAFESARPPIDVNEWRASGYRPTPTIIEAAEALYRRHDVTEISRSDAGAKNLKATSDKIADIIERSKRDGLKSICFITGVPGAGKTLAGLNIAAKRAERHEDEHAVFLSPASQGSFCTCGYWRGCSATCSWKAFSSCTALASSLSSVISPTWRKRMPSRSGSPRSAKPNG